MRFGIRECADMVFKTTAPNQKVGNTVFPRAGMPAFHIDTARTSTVEQATTTVYAQGGRGYARLISWEGEKTMTFTVEDALMSPMGLAVLTGAGLVDASASEPIHFHITKDVIVGADGTAQVSLLDLQEETGLENKKFLICNCSDDHLTDIYGTVLDGSGYGIDYIKTEITVEGANGIENTVAVDSSNNAIFTIGENYENKTVRLDFYILLDGGVQEVTINPDSFGGYFYIEAQTLFRSEATGKDMAAELIFPKVKVQSGFTFTMASTGDPSTFTFTMDAMPGYTKFNRTKKTMCHIQILNASDADVGEESHPLTHHRPVE